MARGKDDAPLADIRVVEYGHYISAPFGARILADLGADVIKVEDPHGDVARRHGPFPDDQEDPEKSGLFLALNAGKRGVVLDLDTEAGREQMLALLADADVLMVNASPSRLDALGLHYSTLSGRFPRLVVTTITPFGLNGPRRDWASSDLVSFHMSGYAPGVAGGVDDPASEPPLRAGGHQAEFVTGLTAATSTLLGLAMAARAGRGTHIDVSANEAMVMMAQSAVAGAAVNRERRSRKRTDTRPGAMVAVLPTRDGHVAISPREQHQWESWLTLLGEPSWGGEERFGSVALRQQHYYDLEPLLIEWTRRHSKEDIYRRAQEAHVPAFPVNTAADLFESPQLAARGFFEELTHPVAGALRYPGFPYRFSGLELEFQRPAPLLGQHTAEVMGRTGAEPRPSRYTPAGTPPSLPLEGVRVLDFSWVIAGPTCTRILANMGAEVVKVESHRRPDPTRRGGGPNFHLLNQSKRSLTLNLGRPEGIDLAKRIVAECDVVIENFATGVVERLGLGYEELRAVRPDLIMISSSGLGHTGPDRHHVAYGTLIQCFTGWSSLTGVPGGTPSPGGVWTDPTTGMLEVALILAALHQRRRTGAGRYVDVAMAEVICSMLPEALMDFAMNGRDQGPLGNADHLFVPHGLYPCRGDDRWVAVAVTSDAEWRGLCDALGDDVSSTAWGETAADRRRRGRELDDIIAKWTSARSQDEVVATLQRHGVPAGPSMDGVEVFEDPHLETRGFFRTHTTNGGRELRLAGLPWQFKPPLAPRVRAAPDLGQDNRVLLAELLKLPDEEISRLIEAEIVH